MIYSIYVDLDYDWDNLKNEEFKIFLKENKFKAMYYMMSKNYIFKKVYIRRSPNNHIHLRFDLYFDVFKDNDIYEYLTGFGIPLYAMEFIFDMFIFRALLKDDPYRISLDLQRYGLTGNLNEINRIFNRKTKNYETKRAGEWLNFDEVVK